MRNYYVFVTILTVLVGLLLLGGLKIVGSPLESRNKELDKRRVDNLDQIVRQVEFYYQDNKKLPTSLDQINSLKDIFDPVTKLAYKYKIVSAQEYEVCATFSTDQSAKPATENYYDKDLPYNKISHHTAGENCIVFTLPEYITSPVQGNTAILPEKGEFSNMSATLNKANAKFNFDYSGKSNNFMVEISTAPDFSENVYLTFAGGSKPPLSMDNTGYTDYVCGKTVYWRIKADLDVLSQAKEEVVCGKGSEISPTPLSTF